MSYLDEEYVMFFETHRPRPTSKPMVLLDGADGRSTSGGDPPASSRADGRARLWRYLLVLFGVVAAGFAGMAVANYFLDPLKFSRVGLSGVVEEFTRGSNVAVVDPNIDFRGLRREHIRQLPATPDVIVTGGSRVQEVTGAIVPGRTFYNAYVTLDGFADTLGVTEMLVAAGRLPKIYITSIRAKQFIPAHITENEDWKLLAPEYRSMAARLGISRPSWWASLPVGHWFDMFSVAALKRRVELWRRAEGRPGPTSETLGTLPILRADGSLGKSERQRRAETPEAGLRQAADRAARDRKGQLHVDSEAVDGLGRMVDLLRSRGTQVVLLMTPLHPAYYGGLAGSKYGQALRQVEQETRRLAEARGAIAAGTFDPAQAPCRDADYQDWIHVTEDCIRLLLTPVLDRPVRMTAGRI